MIQLNRSRLRIILFFVILYSISCTTNDVSTIDKLSTIDTLANGVIKIDSVLQDSIGISWYLIDNGYLSYRYYNDTNNILICSFYKEFKEEFSVTRTHGFKEVVEGSTIQILDQKILNKELIEFKCYFVSPMIIKESYIRVYEVLNDGKTKSIIDYTKLKKEKNLIQVKMNSEGVFYLENRILLNSDSSYFFTKKLSYYPPR